MVATAANAKLDYEAGQNAVAMSAMTDSGDKTTFDSTANLWSQRSGFTPVIRPNGLLTGGAVTPTATVDEISVAALSCNLNGVVTAVSAGTLTITRPATDVAQVFSVTVNAAGSLAIVEGTEGAGSTFVETRDAAGGPPLIPVDSIEIGQVRVNTSASAVIGSSEVFAVVGLHTERADFPVYTANYSAGNVTFAAALPSIHTGGVTKAVYASYASPIFAEVALATDYVPPETSHAVASEQIYNRTLGSSTETLNQGSFTAYLENGVDDPLVALKNEILWFRFYPDRYKTPYILSQGKLGISRTFPAGDNISAACTISATEAASEVAA